MKEKEINIICLFMILLFIGILILVSIIPFKSAYFEQEKNVIGIITGFTIVVLNIAIWTAYIRKRFADGFRTFLLVVFAIPVFIATEVRKNEIDKISYRFDGIVTKKYKSHNHGSRAIYIEGINGGEYEPINLDLWDRIQVGDHIYKEDFSLHAHLNDEIVPIFYPSLINDPKGKYLK